jgi:hypothetical protein
MTSLFLRTGRPSRNGLLPPLRPWPTSRLSLQRGVRRGGALLWLLGAIGGLGLLILILGGLALGRSPTVSERAPLGPIDIARAFELLRAHSPRTQAPGILRTVSLAERELDLLTREGLRSWPGARCSVALGAGEGRVACSLPLPLSLPFLPFLPTLWSNVSASWTDVLGAVDQNGGTPLPELRSLRWGALPLPPSWGLAGAKLLLERHPQGAQVVWATHMLRGITTRPGKIEARYAWNPRAPMRLANSLMPPAEQERLRSYAAWIAQQAATQQPDQALPLPALLTGLFTLAARKTQPAGDAAAAAAENRAAIMALSFFATRRDLGSVVSAAQSPNWPRPQWLTVTLEGREDFALHFLISALIAAEGSGQLSKMVGVYKEVADAKGGSGFSFNDIAADRAGTRMGEMAVHQALVLQQRLARPLVDAQLMPRWHDLPEYLSETDFKRRFGRVGAAPYQEMLGEIDRRVAGLEVWR